MIEAFHNRVDVHWENTKKILGLPLDTKYEKEKDLFVPLLEDEKEMWLLRQIGKTVEYADSYGMGPQMLQNILVREEIYLEQSICKRLLDQRRKARPMVVRWQASIRNEVRATRVLETPLGDRREFRGRLNDNLFRSAYSFKPQSTVGRILELAIQDIHESTDLFIPLLNVHDEVVGQCREEDIPKSMVIIKSLMERPLQICGRELTIPCSFKVGKNWGSLEEIK
jgi:DNA polymerase I-like protein with 3'-5' exonuclease and polymerase domains